MAFRRVIARAQSLRSSLTLGPEAHCNTACNINYGFPLQSTDTISCSGDHGQKQRNAFVHYYRSFRALSRQHSLSDAHVSKPENTPLTQPCRQCQTNSSISAVPADEWNLEYTGVVSSTVRTLKLVSIGTATLSLVGSPLYIMATMDGQYTAVKVMAASGFTCFGLFTTGLLHWFVGPYVHKLWYHAPSEQVKVQLLSIFAQHREVVFNLSDVQHPEGIAPLQTFQAKGRTMFVDEATFENKELLEKLTPPSPFDIDPNAIEEKKEQ